VLLSAASLRKIREKGGTTTRKLIGHSGPVYSVAFDPLSGSSEPPKYLLSASADATTRLWSLDTMSNIVAYHGHQNPIWDVKWSPMGIYFATGSRDRTARLWSTDRTCCLRVFAGHLSDVDVCCISDGLCPMILTVGDSVVSSVPSQLVVPCHWVQRPDGPLVGRSTRTMRPCIRGAPRRCILPYRQSGWSLPGECRYVWLHVIVLDDDHNSATSRRRPGHQSLGLGLGPPHQENDRPHCIYIFPRFQRRIIYAGQWRRRLDRPVLGCQSRRRVAQ
jgi:hypothetical protein